MYFIEFILLGISLSIDAFSLAISLSISNFNIFNKKVYALTVGIFHFLMPIFGYIFSKFLNRLINIPEKQIFSIVIILIIVGIIIDKEKKITKKIINPFIFAFSVSIDSFSIGLTLNSFNLIKSCIIFSIISALFTYFGFIIGYKVDRKIGDKDKIVSILILILILVYNIL